MGNYIIRLDDACERRDFERWDKIEKLLDTYGVKPLVGVIPNCEDPVMSPYKIDKSFDDKLHLWIRKGWVIAMHGYNHVYSTDDGGINPVNKRSEFAGESLEIQREKIRKGVLILRAKGIDPQVFFAPSHTFDENTIIALREESNIEFVSDTIANDSYDNYGITFVPQQSGSVRLLPFKLTTFCYHPNTMREYDFDKLESFLRRKKKKFIAFPLYKVSRKRNILDDFLKKIYFAKR